ncbi:polycomb group protein Psc [Fopius arisanus]|uniref:Polycomb group protein Psc n=1 Tax=Fopius arisanus TaxID=64838 RepID=A0A9R1T2C5_9HYME|nr:PREDICTED: polycomb group protein Psc-like [Fopius arisanus]
MSGQSGGRLKLAKLNEQLTCKLCHGYFIDATTIIECLHSFCRSCIVKYLETNKYCPICEVQVHKSKPLLNIRPDHTLQDIVYKLVPGCYQNEMRCRREFYEKHPEAPLSSMSPEARGEPIESHIYSPDESLSLSLEYYNPTLNDSPICSETDEEKSSSSSKSLPRRYLRCPAAVTVFHLQKLIRAKYGLSDAHRVDIMYKEEPLYGNYTLMDVMYIYHWRRKVPLHLSYRIFESSPKRLKLSEDNENFKASLSTAGITPSTPEDTTVKREWKEVQLKISETGVMSVTGITSPDSKKLKKETIEEDQRKLDESVASVMKPKRKTEDQKDLENKKSASKSPEVSSEDNNNKEKTLSTTITAITTTSIITAAPTTTTTTTSQFSSSTSTSATPLQSKSPEASKSKSSDQKSTSGGSNSQSGSKIESLSAKLQFQPKVGPINHTYSKKSQKEKKSFLEKMLKKADVKPEKEKKLIPPPPPAPSPTKSPSKTSTTTHVNINTFGGCTYSTAPSLSISLQPRRNSSPDRGKQEENQKTNNQNSEPLNVPVIPQSTFPFYMQNLMDGNVKSPSKSSSVASSSPSSSSSSLSPKCQVTQSFSLQTPSISMYSIPTSSAKHQNTSSTPITSSSTRTNSKGLEITSVYSVPPCPDAIPISLMHSSKPTIRKTEILAKGTNVNEICAKISENSREKDKIKTETRTRSEIPDLLKIPLKSSSSLSSLSSLSSPSESSKHGTIPNVPSYTPSNSLTISPSDSKGASKNIPNLSTASPQLLLHSSPKLSNPSKKQGTGFKTLRDPPRPWNPSLSRNNYVAAKNQAKELASEGSSNPSSSLSGSKTITSKPKIFKNRNNIPRYLGNPASGVKPLYGNNESKDSKESSTSKSPSIITKIEPKTLSPISTTNSPIVSPPPYSPNARNYNAPFTRDIGRTSGSSLSPRNSPVNMFTNPFIPNSTPNTNPRIFPQGFMSPFNDAGRFGGPLMRSPMGISSAYHTLPPSINRCIPRSYSGLTYQGLQAPAVQRIPPSSHSSPKSPKISGSAGKEEEGKGEGNAFNLSKSGTSSGGASGASSTSGASDLSKPHEDKSEPLGKAVGKERERRKSQEGKEKEKGKVDEEKVEKDLKDLREDQSTSKSRQKDEPKVEEEEKKEKKELGSTNSSNLSSGPENKLNGVSNPEASGSSTSRDKATDKTSDKEENVKDNKVSQIKEKEEVIVKENKCEELSKEIKAQEQRSKPES